MLFLRRCERIAFIFFVFAVVSGCKRGPQFSAKLQSVGGASILKQECDGFLRTYNQTSGQKYVWMQHDTTFPPIIAAFQPQAVSVTRQGDVDLIDVQVTGGFNHSGLLIAPSPLTPGDFRPSRENWNIWQLAKGVWEYRE